MNGNLAGLDVGRGFLLVMMELKETFFGRRADHGALTFRANMSRDLRLFQISIYFPCNKTPSPQGLNPRLSTLCASYASEAGLFEVAIMETDRIGPPSDDRLILKWIEAQPLPDQAS